MPSPGPRTVAGARGPGSGSWRWTGRPPWMASGRRPQVLFGSVAGDPHSVTASGTLGPGPAPSETAGTVPIVVITPNAAIRHQRGRAPVHAPSIAEVSPDPAHPGRTGRQPRGAGLKGATEVRSGNKEALKFRAILRGSTIGRHRLRPSWPDRCASGSSTPSGLHAVAATDVFTFGWPEATAGGHWRGSHHRS